MSPVVTRSLPVASVGLVVAGLLGLLALFACSASGSSRSGFEEDGGGASSSSSSSSGFVPAEAGANEDGCSDQAKLVYVLSLEGDLYSFAPADKKFTKVGPLNCSLGGASFVPISMAVDRNAKAWVNMRDELGSGEDVLFEVDTKTADCNPSQITGPMGGMGFSTNAGTTDQETLFVVGPGLTPGTPGLARVDFASQKLVPIADLAELIDMELTGTGDGRLYSFLIDTPLAIAEIDKKTTVLSKRVPLPNVPRPMAPMFAFSFWGGDFYVYTATSTSSSSTTNVARYRPSDGSVDTSYMSQIGFHIVGAGVSTCAPTASPK
jgi:hypothetical protein